LSAMLIPERTVDAWVAREVYRLIPSSLIWCPTTNAQRMPGAGRPANAPWDTAAELGRAGCTRKLVLLENKGLADAPPARVNLNPLQAEFLARLSAPPQAVPVFYTLPKLDTARAGISGPIPDLAASEHPRGSDPGFRSWQVVVDPTTVAQVARSERSPSVATIAARAAARAPASTWMPLEAFIQAAARCDPSCGQQVSLDDDLGWIARKIRTVSSELAAALRDRESRRELARDQLHHLSAGSLWIELPGSGSPTSDQAVLMDVDSQGAPP
jgi:hypothetical protein